MAYIGAGRKKGNESMTTRLDEAAHRALATTGGNRAQAQRELVRHVLADDQLLRELVAPFLPALVLKKIEQVMKSGESSTQGTMGRLVLPPNLQAGYNPMRATALAAEAPRRPPASPRHVSTLKLLAAAYAVKRGEPVS